MIRSHLTVSLVASIFPGLLSIALVPIYLLELGVEAYGLVGFQIALAGVLLAFDLGTSSTLVRELAANASDPDLPSLVRTLEALAASAVMAAGLMLMLLAPWVAGVWLGATTMDPTTLRWCVVAIAATITGQAIANWHLNGLMALGRHRHAAATRMLAAVAWHGGSLIALFASHGSVLAFFAWQGLCSVLTAMLCRWGFARIMPFARAPLMWKALHRRRGFTLAMAATAITGVLVANTDRLILSRWLPLAGFGQYALAITIAWSLHFLITPIGHTTVPALTRLRGEAQAMRSFLRERSRLMACAVLPPAGLIAIDGRALIFAWTGDGDLARAVAPLAASMAVGVAAQSLMGVVRAAPVAVGRAAIGLGLDLLTFAILLVGLVVLVPWHGAMGGALAWAGANLCALIIGVPLIYRRLRLGSSLPWLADLALPGAASLIAPLTAWALGWPEASGSRGASAGQLILIASASGLLAIGAYRCPRRRRDGVSGLV